MAIVNDIAAQDDLAALAAIVGAKNVIAAPADMAPYLREWRDLYIGKARAVAKPGNVADVSAIMRWASAHRVPIVPQGGNTGLVGGQIPMNEGREIILSLTRLDALREIDPASNAMTVEAGMTLLRAQDIAAGHDRLFPLSLAAEGTCTIGGNLSTNAGGVSVLAYGNMRDLTLGLEVVLADGRIWNGLTKLRKDNTGYDLKNIFVGAEGTLGIITAATLKLFPNPRSRTTGFIGVESPAAALALLTLAREMTGGLVTTFELIPRIGLRMVLDHTPQTRDPLAAPHPWYVMMELSSQQSEGLTEITEELLAAAMERNLVTDAAIAVSLDQRKAFWKLRESMTDAQRPEGASIKHDVSLPIDRVPEFLDETIAAIEHVFPGARCVPFGHLGDGNIHFNVSRPPGAEDQPFLDRWYEMNDIVHGITTKLGGSISAEHGVGRMKKKLLPGVKDPVALEMMRTLKRALDPMNILNPGAVIDV